MPGDWADEKVREIGRRLNNNHPVRDYEAAYARALRQERAEATARVVVRCAEIASAKAREFQADGMNDFGRYNYAVGVCSEIAAEIRAEKWGDE